MRNVRRHVQTIMPIIILYIALEFSSREDFSVHCLIMEIKEVTFRETGEMGLHGGGGMNRILEGRQEL